jgi:hypothetical protein
MTSPTRLDRPVFLQLAAAMLLLVMAPAQAEVVTTKLQVSAQVVVSCRLDASVPPVGSAQRVNGGASFSVKCTRGAAAAAATCENACASLRPADTARNERHIAEPRGDGTTVATLLF